MSEDQKEQAGECSPEADRVHGTLNANATPAILALETIANSPYVSDMWVQSLASEALKAEGRTPRSG